MRKNAEANRERILVAAQDVFGAQGPEGSTEEVARRAEVGIATVFRHFPTKDALVQAALMRHFATIHERALVLRDTDDAGRALRELVVMMIETGASKITLAGGILASGHVPEPVRDAADEAKAVLGEVLERARGAGLARSDVRVDEVFFLIRGLAQAQATFPASDTTRRAATDVVLRGLLV